MSDEINIVPVDESATDTMENVETESSEVLFQKYEDVKSEYEQVKALEETKDEKKNAKGFLAGLSKIGKTITGIQAFQDRKSAKNIKEACENFYKSASAVTNAKRTELDAAIAAFGKFRLEALHETVGRFLGCLSDMNRKNKDKEYEILDGIGLDVNTIAAMEDVDMKASKALISTTITGGIGLVAVMGTPALVTSVVGAIGTASTGTAISTLSGAAASNAILAWLGGGSLAAGGGGMAAGSAVLTSITVGATAGVAIIAAGIMASVHYAKKLTEAKEYQKDVEIKVAEMEKAWVLLDGITTRTEELSVITEELRVRASKQLDYLEPLAADFEEHDDYYCKVFQKSGLLVKSMTELAQTPLLNQDGDVSTESAQIIVNMHSILNKELIHHE